MNALSLYSITKYKITIKTSMCLTYLENMFSCWFKLYKICFHTDSKYGLVWNVYLHTLWFHMEVNIMVRRCIYNYSLSNLWPFLQVD